MQLSSCKRPSEPLEDKITKRQNRQEPYEHDRSSNPLFIIENSVYLLTSSPYYKESYKILAEISEPISRPMYIHEYEINHNSIVKAITLGYTNDMMIAALVKYMRNKTLPHSVINLINDVSKKYNCAKMYLETTLQQNYVVLEMDIKAYNQLTNEQLYQFNNKQILKEESESPPGTKRFKITPYRESDEARILYTMKMPFHYEYAYNVRKGETRKTTNAFIIGVQKNTFPLKDLRIELRTFTQLRPYQEAALKAVFSVNNKKEQVAKSGIIVLPCGAGKTLLGISICCKLKKDTLIVCPGDVSAEQWRQQLERWTCEINPEQIMVLTSKTEKKFQLNTKSREGVVLISTYPFLSGKLTVKQPGLTRDQEWISRTPWGLVIYDEVQWLPAMNYKNILSNIQCHTKIGLTATLYRQDEKVSELYYLIGPLMYEGNWRDFVDAGYLANPYCIEIRARMTDYFSEQYRKSDQQKTKKELLYCANPNKIRALFYLVKIHEEREDSTLVFCDSIPLIRYINKKLSAPMVYGQINSEEKGFIYEYFRRGHYKTILVSRTGDEAIDLPNANVAIELNIHKGSRRQALQRLGRIMRPKANSNSEYNAFFYTLVSEDTSEKKYFDKRQKQFVNLGFQYDIISERDLEYNDPSSRYYKMIKELEMMQNEDKYLNVDLKDMKNN